jgi:hypothetical protein
MMSILKEKKFGVLSVTLVEWIGEIWLGESNKKDHEVEAAISIPRIQRPLTEWISHAGRVDGPAAAICSVVASDDSVVRVGVDEG